MGWQGLTRAPKLANKRRQEQLKQREEEILELRQVIAMKDFAGLGDPEWFVVSGGGDQSPVGLPDYNKFFFALEKPTGEGPSRNTPPFACVMVVSP